MKCIHPIKVNRVMKEFLSGASTLTYTATYANMDKLDAWVRGEGSFEAAWYEKEAPVSFNIINDKHFATLVDEDDRELSGEVDILVDRQAILTHGCSKMDSYGVLADMKQRSKIAKGFATITLVLLHELGHQEMAGCNDMSEEESRAYDDFAEAKVNEAAQQGIFKTEEERLIALNLFHINKPDEILATDWALNWLEDAEHRKFAKQFEKKFFACYDKRA